MRALIKLLTGCVCGSLIAGAAAADIAASTAASAKPAAAISTHPKPAAQASAGPAPAAAALQSRGAYLATQGDCAACHTAAHNTPAYGGGKAVNSPFGKIYSTNISPDRDNGIGDYTFEDFTHALRDGVRKDGKRLYPAMPYASYAAMSTDDLRDLYRYFMSEVTPVAFAPTPTKLAFPFNQRWALIFWDGLFKNQDVFQPDATHDTLWNRGAYLVRSVGHCGSCHTPRGVGYQEKGYSEQSSGFLSGGLVDHWFAANLRADVASGLGRWREQDVVDFLKTGHGGGAIVFGSMGEVVHDSTQHFHDDDLRAIAHYLKSLAPAGEQASYRSPEAVAPVVVVSGEPPLLIEKPGAGLFGADCAKCHNADGAGKPPRFPALAGNPSVLADNPSSVIRIILEGAASPTTAANPKPEKMPAFSTLNDTQIADIVNFVRGSWGNNAPRASAQAVKILRLGIKE
jgi:mono/diheme cytochrome c family protein